MASPLATPNAIRFLVLSDTHDTAFPPPEHLPPADVVLHCGDLTMIGGLSNYKTAIKSLSECQAELKLVIPGNHDVSMDHKWWMENLEEKEEDDPEEPEKAHALFQGAEKEHEVKLLEEGRHEFKLRDGRKFSLFASPYTPAFGGYAFAYDPEEDYWDRIPNNVDILMTHGPPRAPQALGNYRRDLGHKGEHCGCPNLWSHLERSKPRLHCFGHIHEGHGATWVDWEKEICVDVASTMSSTVGLIAVEVANRDKTLLVNAAIQTHGEQRNNHPWLIDMEG